jgi:hypothetical protein
MSSNTSILEFSPKGSFIRSRSNKYDTLYCIQMYDNAHYFRKSEFISADCYINEPTIRFPFNTSKLVITVKTTYFNVETGSNTKKIVIHTRHDTENVYEFLVNSLALKTDSR